MPDRIQNPEWQELKGVGTHPEQLRLTWEENLGILSTTGSQLEPHVRKYKSI